MIEITHDPGEGVAYIGMSTVRNRFSQHVFEGKFGTVIVDVDADGNPVGVEVLA